MEWGVEGVRQFGRWLLRPPVPVTAALAVVATGLLVVSLGGYTDNADARIQPADAVQGVVPFVEDRWVAERRERALAAAGN